MALLLNELGQFLGTDDCAVDTIRFAFVVPRGRDLRVTDVQGRLCEWKNMAGISWPNDSNVASYISGNFIVSVDIDPTVD
jgi:hypothetical protein